MVQAEEHSHEKVEESHQDLLEALTDAIEDESSVEARAILSERHPAEVAQLLESIPSRDRDFVWALLTPEQHIEVLAYTEAAVRSERLRRMPPEDVAAAAQYLDTDDAVDILQDLPAPVVDKVLESMDAWDRKRIEAVLVYPEDTAGGLMNVDAMTVRGDVTLEAVLRYLRIRRKVPASMDALIVVDHNNRYQGLLALTDLLTSDPSRKVGEVMAREVDGLEPTTPATEVAKLFEQRDLISAPVVDAEGVVLGRITIDDVVDVIRDEGEHTVMSMAGLTEDEDIFAPVLTTARQRTLWLGINLATALLASWVIGLFEATIRQVVALAVLMPIVASMGGIAGSQTLTVVIRGMALGHVGSSNARLVLVKEVLVGLLTGIFWAVVVAATAGLWFESVRLGLIIGAAMEINLLVAALAGATIPIILRRLSIDPALAGGVVLTTVTDVIGFMAFLGLGTIFLLR